MKTRNVLIALVALAIGGPRVAFAQDTALVIGNSDYDQAACLAKGWDVDDLSAVVGDVVNKNNALRNAGWSTVVVEDRTAAQMKDDINQTGYANKKYIVWYSGHGADPTGNLLGKDCQELDANEFVTALKGPPYNALVILDSCFGADFANAVNAKLGGAANANGVGFITGASKGECTWAAEDKSEFTRCFVRGLNGEADGWGPGGPGGARDGEITVEEAAEYAKANCLYGGKTPTWDGEHGGWVIGEIKKVPTLPVWGLIGLGVILASGGAVLVGRRRASAVD